MSLHLVSKLWKLTFNSTRCMMGLAWVGLREPPGYSWCYFQLYFNLFFCFTVDICNAMTAAVSPTQISQNCGDLGCSSRWKERCKFIFKPCKNTDGHYYFAEISKPGLVAKLFFECWAVKLMIILKNLHQAYSFAGW